MRMYTFSIKEISSGEEVIPQILDKILRAMPADLKLLQWRISHHDVITSKDSSIDSFEKIANKCVTWEILYNNVIHLDQIIDIEISSIAFNEIENIDNRVAELNFTKINLYDSTEWVIESRNLAFLKQLLIDISED